MSGSVLQQLVQQGSLNRLRAHAVFSQFPSLNVTADYLGPEGIDLEFQSEATDFPPTMTGLVPSPAPYVTTNVRLQLLRTQGLAGAWQNQSYQTTVLGNATLHTDVSIQGVSQLRFRDVGIRRLPPFRMNGRDPYYVIELFGALIINGNLMNIV